MKRNVRRALLLIFALALTLLTACRTTCPAQPLTEAGERVLRAPEGNAGDETGVSRTQSAAATEDVRPGVAVPVSYTALYDTAGFSERAQEVSAVEDLADGVADVVIKEDAADAEAESAAVGTDYSQTNVQAAGIDEADVVKTDGEYLYLLSGETLTIVRADGEDTAVVSQTAVCGTEKTEAYYESSWATGLYLDGGRAVVLYERYYGVELSGGVYRDRSTVGARIYDVADPAAPALVADLAQDGYLADSRVADGVLCLVTEYSVYDARRDEPETFIPCVYARGAQALLPCDHIYLPEDVRSSVYAVVRAIDLSSGQALGELAALGGCDYLYMSADNLYLAAVESVQTTGAAREEGGARVQDVVASQRTHILRIPLDGALTLAASGVVDGRPLSQYSFDESGGYLRAVLTTGEDRYTVREYADDLDGVSAIEASAFDDDDSCALYVLDMALDVVSSLTDVAEDERVYAVRFDGEMVYFVTFRETDPLFAADLTDPAAPVIRSALKLPGYSSSLHVWSDGLLFGLGRMVDEKTGEVQGVKLALYDASDPDDLREESCLTTEWTYTPAEDSAHALFLDPARGLVGFAASDYRADCYVLYACGDGAFSEWARYDLSGWIYSARATRIGEALYITGENELIAAALDSGAVLAQLRF